MAKKIGAGVFMASMRLGMAELRAMFSLGGNVEQQTPYGAFLNETPGEVADARRDKKEQPAMNGNANLPTPSQVIDNPNAYQPERQGQTQQQAMERGNGDSLPTPSQVIDNPQAYQPEPTPGHEQQHGYGHEM